MAAYYNEFDHEKAAWLRELIKRNLIAPGEVDERDINDIAPNELVGFTQHHFFAGIGIWSYALRKAGWPDDRPVWTASCPCQPFSSAGKGDAFDDERHLWPSLFWLIQQFRPVQIFGEQVASKDGRAWFDLVQADLEGAAYTSGAVNTCAAGYGAPELRQRLYWMAYTESGGSGTGLCNSEQAEQRRIIVADNRCNGGMADTDEARSQGRERPRNMELQGGAEQIRPASACSVSRSIAAHNGACPTNGFWEDADWLFCRDEKWRPVKPGTFPLADGAPARVVRLRGYGDGIVAPQAQAFIEAAMSL